VRAPVACGYLAGYVASRRGDADNHDVIASEELRDAATVEQMVDLLLRSDPELVALSAYVWNARTVADVVGELRRRGDATIVLGGPDVQYTPDVALRRFDADFICNGEGELALLGLIERLADDRLKTHEEPPAGMVSRCGDGGPAPLVSELDTIPSPFRMGIIEVPESGWVDMETVRGCPFTCSFCLYGKNLANVRSYSLERIRTDLEWVLDHGASDIYFLDPTFNLPRDRCRAILDMLAELNEDRQTRVWIEARAEAVDDDLAERLAAAGVVSVEVGLQAVQPSALKLMHRGLGRKGFIRGCERLRERRIGVDIGVILGLPGDSVESIRHTIAYATQDLLGEVSAYRLRVLPGSDYWARGAELGLEYSEDPPYFIRSTATLSETALKDMEGVVAEILEAHNAAYRELIARPSARAATKKSPLAAKKEMLATKKEALATKKEGLVAKRETLPTNKEPAHGLT
jgi:radical SAM superfamily enzyme YgiQ (UPF0313 family)